MDCLTKKCENKISKFIEQENKFSLYQHLIREHPELANRKMQVKADVALHDLWKLMGQMEKACMCRKRTVLERMGV